MQYVIGLGTGRCGTTSLARLLNLQPGASVVHQRGPVLSWYEEHDPARHLTQPDSGPDVTLLGDVGFYYLPHVGRIWEEMPTVKFVCMRRGRQATIDSFERYLRPEWNHWAPNKTVYSPWDQCYPVIQAATRTDAIGRYWDKYYATAENLASDYRFEVFDIESLNSEEGVSRLLRFVGVQDPVLATGIRVNRSH